ncbi:hypothetical protein ASG11_12735 [Sphingomonas sp. Leaf357]|uniref:MFS transporter n=1 Tax=Sphingomonas sp. Leaf357 TaxID=1736350 RepID=UPI0006F361C4|nr:MFS transporter [Sphingomonas sp. Leaf357]KQS05007.1 hypothetical protein ASG11_12735 [Sphingomonas sp. Leaf357]
MRSILRPAGFLGLDACEWATIAIALAAATLPAVLPLMVGVLARQFGMGLDQAGYVIAINMGSILLGSLACAVLGRRFSWFALIVGGLLVMTAGNVLTLSTSGLTALVATRLISGLGEGVVAACCYALMGQARLPGRSIAIYAGGQSIVGAAAMAVLPTLIAHHGWHVFYLLVVFAALPAFALVPLAVRGREQVQRAAGAGRPALNISAFGGLLAIFVFFVGLAMVWAFMERLGSARHLSLLQLSAAMSASSLAGLAGSLASGAVTDRLRLGIGLGFGIALIVASLVMMFVGGFAPFTVGVCGLYFAWTFQFPFLFECLVAVDRDGRATVLTPVATGGGLTIGPAIGGFVLQNGSLSLLCLTCLALTLAGTVLAWRIGGKRRSAAVEEATA